MSGRIKKETDEIRTRVKLEDYGISNVNFGFMSYLVQNCRYLRQI
jgi:hypothetical protein